AAGKPYDSVSVKIQGAEYNLTRQGFICRPNTINLIAFDRNSTVPYIGVPFQWFNRAGRSCGREPWVINSFTPTELVTGNNDDIIQYVNNIPAGDSVVLFNINDAGYASWPASAKAKLGELGISVAQIDALLPGEPVVIFARKGLAPGSAKIFRTTFSPASQQKLVVNETITGRYNSGTMKSGLIGPAQQWKNFVVDYDETEAVDTYQSDVFGVTLSGQETLLKSNLANGQDLSDISASEYPYLKLIYKTADDVNLTPVQLNQWMVLYEPVADGLLLYKGPLTQQALFEGETWNGDYRFVNISDKTFPDSLTVSYDIFNKTSINSLNKKFKIKAPVPADTTKFSLAINTQSLLGLNDVHVFVNPRIVAEQYYDNNVVALNDHLLVSREEFNPVLDVTIDGRYVTKDDFVSADPVIRIRVWDENPFLLIQDTSRVDFYLAYPCQDESCSLQRINFKRTDVSWVQATDTTDFVITFNPQDLAEGRYKLLVEARDAVGNKSGGTPYEITFQVSYNKGIAILDPFPNPLQYSTTFSFIVEGSQAPEKFSISMVNTSGQQVAEFSADELPVLHVGTNEFHWDARDEDGNPLANGIYFFRILVETGSGLAEKTGRVAIVR
ncbi:MAG: FlgD immunoglobulin-like domain containing protein, partial [Bacteroidota bacterium]